MILETVGKKTIGSIEEVGKFTRFISQTCLSCFYSLSKAKSYSLIRTQMNLIGVRSVPVIMITGAFVGMILAIQTYNQLASMGLEERLGVLISLSVVKELGPVLSAVMLAGRIGGAMTAELGTMNVTEQIAAVRSMGTDPLLYLVSPRVLAGMLLTPFLIIYADLLGVLGGYLVSVIHYGVNNEAYWNYTAQGVELWDISVGVVKGLFFGATIAVISCYKGFTCKEGAHGVGQSCTEAFVLSFIMILILDFVMVMLEKGIYYSIWPMQSLL